MKPRLRYALGALLVNAGGLAAVLIAMALGASSHRWWPTAAFLSIGTTAALCAELIHQLARLRARWQADADVPRGVLLRKPFWISLGEPLAVIDFGCPLAAAPAALGFAGVGVGIMLTVGLLPLVAIPALVAIPIGLLSPDDLTFEPEGLRVHTRRASFLVRWSAIAGVEREGAAQRPLTSLELHETASAVASVVPDTPRNRRRVYLTTYGGNQPGGKLTLLGWTGGLDAPVLARAIRAAIDGGPARPN